MGEVVVLTATSAGTTTSLVDEINLYQQNSTLAGMLGYVVSAADSGNVGAVFRVTGNTKAASSIAFVPALPAATAAGDVVELVNEHDLGFTVRELHSHLDLAIDAVKDYALEPATSDEATFDATSPLLAIPAAWTAFNGADWQDPEGLWHPVGQADLRVDRTAKTVELRNAPRWWAHARPVRLRGYTQARPLTADADETNVDAEWLVAETAARLQFAVAKRQLGPSTSDAYARYNELRRIADALRAKVQETRPTGRFVRLTPA